MHTAAFVELGIDADWAYEAIDLTPEDFERGVLDLQGAGYVGANVTVPHKRAALALADTSSEAAGRIGAANTLSFGRDGIHADNTDAGGFLAALPGAPAGKRAVVLGAGGSARAVVWGLRGAGAEVAISNRTTERARELAAELGGEVLEADDDLDLSGVDLLVNTTSVGLSSLHSSMPEPGSGLKALRIAADQLSDRLVVVDLVYGAAPTELSAAASRAGASLVSGLEILVHQGAESFRIWTGLEPPREAMRRAAALNP